MGEFPLALGSQIMRETFTGVLQMNRVCLVERMRKGNAWFEVVGEW